jgi:hypothetical protein
MGSTLRVMLFPQRDWMNFDYLNFILKLSLSFLSINQTRPCTSNKYPIPKHKQLSPSIEHRSLNTNNHPRANQMTSQKLNSSVIMSQIPQYKFLQDGIFGSFTYPWGDCIGMFIGPLTRFWFYFSRLSSLSRCYPPCFEWDLILDWEPILFRLLAPLLISFELLSLTEGSF